MKKSLVICLMVLSIVGSLFSSCSPTTVGPGAPQPLSTPDLCTWLLRALSLRRDLINSSSEFTDWYQARGVGVLLLGSFNELDSLIPILRNSVAAQDKFIEGWVALGAHPEARDYWDTQITSIRMRTRAFETMIDGIQKRDRTVYDNGFSYWEQAGQIGLEAETLEKPLVESCR